MRNILAIALLCACTAQQRSETSRAASVFECEVAVLAPFVPEALDASELVRGIVMGQVQLPVVLGRLGVAAPEALKAIDDFNTCFAGAQAPEPEPVPEGETSLRAPPPAYGNRWL